jgi:ribosome modulation factor
MKPRNEIYQDGWEACREGEDRDDNPYEIYTSNYTYWKDGWYECMILNLQSEPRGMGAAFEDYDA